MFLRARMLLWEVAIFTFNLDDRARIFEARFKIATKREKNNLHKK